MPGMQLSRIDLNLFVVFDAIYSEGSITARRDRRSCRRDAACRFGAVDKSVRTQGRQGHEPLRTESQEGFQVDGEEGRQPVRGKSLRREKVVPGSWATAGTG